MNPWLVRILALVAVLMMLAPTALAQDAAALYKSKCAMCHAADGSGSVPMGQKTGAHDFRSPEIQKMTDAQLIEITAKGKNKMPGYEKKMSAEEIKGLVAYIRELMKKK
jgi:mono/diheme cytochrome c family protein